MIEHSYKLKQDEWDKIKKIYAVPEAAPLSSSAKSSTAVADSMPSPMKVSTLNTNQSKHTTKTTSPNIIFPSELEEETMYSLLDLFDNNMKTADDLPNNLPSFTLLTTDESSTHNVPNNEPPSSKEPETKTPQVQLASATEIPKIKNVC